MLCIIRSKFWIRAIASFFILTIIQSAFFSYYSFALTTGPHQPEYTSYEEPGAQDLVNLLTGDFTFSLPILEVPGPEGSFSVPLTYNAGIGLEQEASWVGLGWTMNVGAITRSYSGFPDDANGETQSITVKDLTGIRGWSSNILGFGQIGWDTQNGHYGSISILGLIGGSYNDSGVSSVGIIGVNFSSDGVTVDPVQFTMAVMTLMTYGAAAASAPAGQAATAVATQAAVDVGSNIAASAVLSASTPAAPTAGYWKYSKKTKQKFFHKEYKIWLDKTRYEDMFGTLYLQNPEVTVNSNSEPFVDLSLKVNNTTSTLYQFKNENYQGAASDINHDLPKNVAFYDVTGPATLATDDYQVNGPGISGSIVPYRLDIGSVSMPREMSSKHKRLVPLKYLNYKVPFIYEGIPSNNYFHHVGAASSITTPAFYYGLTTTQGNPNPNDNGTLTYNLSDIIFGSSARVRADVNSEKKVPMANHIEWLTNDEMRNISGAFPSGTIDFLSGTNRANFRRIFDFGPTNKVVASTSNFSTGTVTVNSINTPLFSVGQLVDIILNKTGTSEYQYYSEVRVNGIAGNSITFDVSRMQSSFINQPITCSIDPKVTIKSKQGIGAYSVTAANGLTYHFALPSYDYDFYARVEKVTDPNNKYSEITRSDKFANTWLLTGVTGPDFVDRGGAGGAGNGILDDADWGYWVKFNYGRYSSDFKWRIPYEPDDRIVDSENASQSYSQGKKQLFYLNSIETRSHVALFIKDLRDDSKSINNIRSLKLSEIQLLSQEHYRKLVADYYLPDVSNTIATVLRSGDFTPAARNFMKANTLKQVKFEHTYNLCSGVPSSINGGGKLTLERVSIRGKNDFKITPDYIFTYGFNPAYNKFKWDGWGMYNNAGNNNYNSHAASLSNQDGAAWSLAKITTPLGAEVLVDYERDTYSSIAGISTNFSTNYYGGEYSNLIKYVPIDYVQGVSNISSYNVGDQVRLRGSYTMYCADVVQTNNNYDLTATITAISGDKITVNTPFITMQSGCNSTTFNLSHYGNIQKINVAKKGGNIRVKAITYRDGAIEKKTRYLYSPYEDNRTDVTSGVVANEPDYIRTTSQTYPDNIDVPGYPMTPVMYGKVTILTGKLTNDLDYHTKQVYEFETPHHSMLVHTKEILKDKVRVATEFILNDFLTMTQNKISDYTSKIGTLKSVKLFDRNNTLYSQSINTYTSVLSNLQGVANQGVYSEGTLMFDRVIDDNSQLHKINRTTVIKYPYVQKMVTTTKDGLTSKSENLNWDFISAEITEKLETSPRGFIVKSVKKPAFRETAYAEMGSKATNVGYKNMLLQEAANYVYRADPSGNPIGLISASVITWKKDWANYRIYNSGPKTFSDGAEGANVWRKAKSYVWRGNMGRLKSDGTQTFAPGDQFNFTTGAANAEWQYIGETLRYGHTSMPLESKNLNNISSTTILGYGNKSIIASAVNAQFGEVAFSSAEDLSVGASHFGGEVGIGTGTVKYESKGQLVTGGAPLVYHAAHTGDAVVELTATGDKSFVYKTINLIAGKRYKISVWTHVGQGNGGIYTVINGAANTVVPAAGVEPTNGKWYLLNHEFTVPSNGLSIEVGVISTQGTIWFDDFRLQPVDAAMTCYVHHGADFFNAENSTDIKMLEYVLDNENLFTKYEYNERGQLIKTYEESFKYGVKLVSESKSDFKRFYYNQ